MRKGLLIIFYLSPLILFAQNSRTQDMNWGSHGGIGTDMNLGGAYNFGNSWDLRLELPIMVFLSSYGTSALAPALTLMGGCRW